MADWQTYQELRKSKENPTVLFLKAGARDHYYGEDGIWLWAPFDNDDKNNPDADPNCFSYVLLVQFGACNIVLGGDMPTEKWAKLHEKWSGKFLKVHLLKASHHGRKSGYHMESVKAMNPDITVVSVGELKKKDDAAASYERFSNVGCFSTLDYGDLVATCWEDGDVWLRDSYGKRIDRPEHSLAGVLGGR